MHAASHVETVPEHGLELVLIPRHPIQLKIAAVRRETPWYATMAIAQVGANGVLGVSVQNRVTEGHEHVNSNVLIQILQMGYLSVLGTRRVMENPVILENVVSYIICIHYLCDYFFVVLHMSPVQSLVHNIHNVILFDPRLTDTLFVTQLTKGGGGYHTLRFSK